MAQNTLAKFEVGGISIVVANMDGELFAFPPLCPHMAEPLEQSGICGDGVLTCTKHLWQWDLRTGAPIGEAERPLLLYPIKREGNDIFVEVEKELT